MYAEFRDEIANHVVGNIPTKRWEEMFQGFFESIVIDTLQTSFNAVNMQDSIFNGKLYHRNFLKDDIHDFFCDYSSKIATRILLVSANTTNTHRWVYKITNPLNIIVGSDPRDTITDPTELEPLPIEPEEDNWYGNES